MAAGGKALQVPCRREDRALSRPLGTESKAGLTVTHFTAELHRSFHSFRTRESSQGLWALRKHITFLQMQPTSTCTFLHVPNLPLSRGRECPKTSSAQALPHSPGPLHWGFTLLGPQGFKPR